MRPSVPSLLRRLNGAARALLAAGAVLFLADTAGAQGGIETLPEPTRVVFDAVMKNDLAAVKERVEKGADVTLRNARGLTPAEFAVEIGNIEIANYLLVQERSQLRAQQEAKDRPGRGKTKAAAAKKSATPGETKTAAPKGSEPTPESAPARETVTTEPPPVARPKESGNFFRWIAGVMSKPDEPPPPKTETREEAKAEEPKKEEPKKEEPRKESPKPESKQSKPVEPLPPPERPRRSRNFFEWMADRMAGREELAYRRPNLPEGLREPPETAETKQPVL